MVVYLAADPGKNGALVAINENSEIIDRMATPRISKTGPVDLIAEYQFIEKNIKDADRAVLIIEDVHALYGVSTIATSSLMENKGQLHGIMTGFTLRYPAAIHFLAPKAWQKEVWSHVDKVFKSNKIDTKATSLACAKRLWAGYDFRENSKCRVAHDGIVDALLMAEAARRLNL